MRFEGRGFDSNQSGSSRCRLHKFVYQNRPMRQNDRVDLCVENVRLIAAPTSVTIAGGVFAHIGSPPPRTGIYIDGGGCWLLPGLVNAHDHLGLDLLPRLGAPPYPNSIAWGEAVYRPRDSPLREVLGLSYSERLFWGAYRNLLAGVTTVQHHDRSHWCLGRLPVRVPAYRWLHRPAGSLGGSYGRGGPLFVHCAEGIDTASFTEVQALQARGLLGPASVLIHGIAIGDADIDLLARTGTAVVCCPTSNLFLFGRTAPIEKLQQAGISGAPCSGHRLDRKRQPESAGGVACSLRPGGGRPTGGDGHCRRCPDPGRAATGTNRPGSSRRLHLDR